MIVGVGAARVLLNLGYFKFPKIKNFPHLSTERSHEVEHLLPQLPFFWTIGEYLLVPDEEFENGIVLDEFFLDRPSFYC